MLNDPAIPLSRPEEESPLVMRRIDEGILVYPADRPEERHLVSGFPEAPKCDCEAARGKRKATCVHIAAVARAFREGDLHLPDDDPEPPAAAPGAAKPKVAEADSPPPPQMLLKRSGSPDGRIDSLSVEFTLPVEGLTVSRVRDRAKEIVALQGDILRNFLENGHANGFGHRKSDEPQRESPTAQHADDRTSTPARISRVEFRQTRWGASLCLVFEVEGGDTVRLFGNRRKLVEALADAGHRESPDSLRDGVRLDLPCRVVLRREGKYDRIQEVLPPERGRGR